MDHPDAGGPSNAPTGLSVDWSVGHYDSAGEFTRVTAPVAVV
jgi:hypothetical protein